MQIVTNDFKTELREENHWLLFAPIPVLIQFVGFRRKHCALLPFWRKEGTICISKKLIGSVRHSYVAFDWKNFMVHRSELKITTGTIVRRGTARLLRGHWKGSFINCVTRDAAVFRPKFTPSPPSPSSSANFVTLQFFRIWPHHTVFCPLSVYYGLASCSILPVLGLRHARKCFGFTPPSSPLPCVT